MRSWTISFLSVSLLLLAACASTQRKPTTPTGSADLACIQKFIPEFKAQWYRSTIDVQGRHFSGLFLFKTMPDSSMRVVFTNEAGVKFFDYEFSKNGSFRMVESIKPLRRKIVSKVLSKDIMLMALLKARTENVCSVSRAAESRVYSFGSGSDIHKLSINSECTQLTKAERFDGDDPKARAEFYGNLTVPDSIFVSHTDFDMDIKLRLLNK